MKSQVISVAVVVSLLVGCSSTPSISADHPSIGTPGNESIYPPAEIFGYYNDLGKAGYNAIKAALLERCVPDKKSGALAALEMGIAEFYKEGRAEEIIEFLDAHKDDIIDNVDLTDKSNEQIDKEMKRLNWHYSHTLRFYQFSLVDELELERMLLQDINKKTMEIYFDIRKALRAVWHTSRYDLIELLDKVEKAWENIEWVEEKILPSGSVQKRDWMKTLRHDLSQALELLKYGYYSDVEKYSTTEIIDKCVDEALSEGKLWASTKGVLALVMIRNVSRDIKQRMLSTLEHYAEQLNKISNSNTELAAELFDIARREIAPNAKHVVKKNDEGRYVTKKRE